MPFALSHRVLLVLSLLSLLARLLPGCGGGNQAPEATTYADVTEQAEEVATAPSNIPDFEIPDDKPIEPLQVSEGFAPADASGAVEGVPAATNTAPIVAIANFYADLPGIDMPSLTDAQRERFLHRANSELCTCGCKDDTLAKCYINDPSCPLVKDMLKSVLEEVRSGK